LSHTTSYEISFNINSIKPLKIWENDLGTNLGRQDDVEQTSSEGMIPGLELF
jgi:hypothetical protein